MSALPASAASCLRVTRSLLAAGHRIRVVAALGLGTILSANLDYLHVMPGVDSDTPWTWFLTASYFGAFLIGAAWAGWLKVTLPAAFQTIGLGAHSTTTADKTRRLFCTCA